MKACASVSGGVMFIPDQIERKLPKIAAHTCNDNQGQMEAAPNA